MGRLVRVIAVIDGVVQGVGYRWFATRSAMKFGLTGNVTNLPGGEVRIVVEGEEGVVKDFIKELRTGPPHASVSSIRTKEEPYTGEFKGFGVEFN